MTKTRARHKARQAWAEQTEGRFTSATSARDMFIGGAWWRARFRRSDLTPQEWYRRLRAGIRARNR